MPAITDAVTINGYSQDGASVNTKQKGTNARLLIEISGANAPVDAIGLVIAAGPTTVRGLVINRFRSGGLNGDGISMGNGAGNTGNVIAGNFIGTDPSGKRDRGNEGRGIECFGDCADALIGGPDPADRNLVSGNGSSGVLLFADDNRVEGNLIGTDKSGRSASATTATASSSATAWTTSSSTTPSPSTVARVWASTAMAPWATTRSATRSSRTARAGSI